MGFLDSLMQSELLREGWEELKSMEDLEHAERLSYDQPVVLFKHSVTCGTSAYAKSRLEDLKVDGRFKFYYLDLLSHRDISNAIASSYRVIHQSPQVIILRDGQPVFDVSHHGIDAKTVLERLT